MYVGTIEVSQVCNNHDCDCCFLASKRGIKHPTIYYLSYVDINVNEAFEVYKDYLEDKEHHWGWFPGHFPGLVSFKTIDGKHGLKKFLDWNRRYTQHRMVYKDCVKTAAIRYTPLIFDDKGRLALRDYGKIEYERPGFNNSLKYRLQSVA